MLNEEEARITENELTRKERNRHNALLAGVVFFMILIIVLWIMNMAMFIKREPVKAADNVNIDKLTADFETSFNEVDAKIGDLKNIDAADLKKSSSSPIFK
jgi:ABC-type phosphate transport system permease subunit